MEKFVVGQTLGGLDGWTIAALKVGVQHELHNPDMHICFCGSVHGIKP
jgi:hypothetical protein